MSNNANTAKASYYRMRMDHTLRHTQQSTRLIYLVSAAVGAAAYFVLREEGFNHRGVVTAAILFVLCAINFIQALLILRQGKWYRDLDRLYAEVVEARRPEEPEGWRRWWGTHPLYASIHFLLAGILFVGAYSVGPIDWALPAATEQADQFREL